ncbi:MULTISPECIES: response regulator transcription factor [Emticicia]|uniref:response regulator n=1 Tax=Emticicia TaxID=312278 RepID=UPI00209F3F90|nr:MULTISPECIES: response regulator transcription factor [Emticicia]UTA69239.1 response regulator transcription factor [Emticicia sp. 21SJ11W-3]
MQKIKILIADDHTIVAESLGMLINRMPDFEVVATVKNGQEALAYMGTHEIDMVLSDLQMPVMGGIETTIRIRKEYPHVKTILLTMSEDATVIKEALVAGIDGYIVKSIEKKELEAALKRVINGQKYFSDAVVMRLAEIPNQATASGKDEIGEHVPLTAREIEIMQLIIQEFTNAEIAEKIFISPTTVETHRRNLMKKLGVSSALALMKYAMKHGLVK